MPGGEEAAWEGEEELVRAGLGYQPARGMGSTAGPLRSPMPILTKR